MKLRIEFLYCLTDEVGRGRTITNWQGVSVPRVGEFVWLASRSGSTQSYFEVTQVAWYDPDHVKCVVRAR